MIGGIPVAAGAKLCQSTYGPPLLETASVGLR